MKNRIMETCNTKAAMPLLGEHAMFKRDTNAQFRLHTSFWSGQYYQFFAGGGRSVRKVTQAEYQELLSTQQHDPCLIMFDGATNKRWWMFRGKFYLENEGYSDPDVKTLILDDIARSEKRVKKATSHSEGGKISSKRDPIPDQVKIFVWQRDSGRCVKCGSDQNLEFDHIIPISMGGSNSARNLQLLCENCNRAKGGNLI
jgi:hypothetical protein